jgi:hypothetical protein
VHERSEHGRGGRALQQGKITENNAFHSFTQKLSVQTSWIHDHLWRKWRIRTQGSCSQGMIHPKIIWYWFLIHLTLNLYFDSILSGSIND